MIVSDVWNGTVSSPGMSGTYGRDPAATTMCRAVSGSPSTSSTFGAVNRVWDRMTSTPLRSR